MSDYPLSSKVTIDLNNQFHDICKSQEENFSPGWSVVACMEDITIQLDIYLKRVCSYIPNQNPSTIRNIRLSHQDRVDVLDYITKQRDIDPNYSVIDVGGAHGGWSFHVINAMVDKNIYGVNKPNNITIFESNINFESEWEPILEYVRTHGKFSFAICSHTLEDIALPQVAMQMLPRIAQEGFVAVPSKYREFSEVEGLWQGYHHHRWICSFRNGIFKLYPKLGWVSCHMLFTSTFHNRSTSTIYIYTVSWSTMYHSQPAWEIALMICSI